MKSAFSLLAAVFAVASPGLAQSHRDFEGPLFCEVVWNQNRARWFGIAQSPLDFIDRSLGDLPGFARKIRTEAKWDDTRLVTLTAHFSETAEAVSGGVTGVLKTRSRSFRESCITAAWKTI